MTPSSAGAQTYSIACTGSGGSANASSTVTATTPAVSITNAFSPSAATIPTSEGAPYGSTDILFRTSFLETSSAYGYGPTKVLQAYICLNAVVRFSDCTNTRPPTGPLSQQLLDAIERGIRSYAGTGNRLIIRFVYNFGPLGAPDAPIDVISTHIDQLAPILLRNRDLIFALQAGFIGTWGEWHTSTSGNTTVAVHKQLLDKELSYFKGVFPIQVRAAASLLEYLGSPTPQEAFGLHDDYYASDDAAWNPLPIIGEATNYTRDQIAAFAEQVSKTSTFVGEFGDKYPPLQSCAALDAYSRRFNVQSIALHVGQPGQLAQDYLQEQGCVTSFYNKVGTRIELQGATLIGNSGPGGSMFVALTMVNGGYGRVIRARPATLVFLSSGSVVGQVPISLQDLDLRQLVASSPATPKTFQFTVTLPSSLPPGRSITVALLVPDPAPSLTSQAAYALPLNSVDRNGNRVFDFSTGYNTIGSFTSGATGQGNNFVLRPQYATASPLELTGNWSGESASSASVNTVMSMQLLPSSLRTAVARLQGTPRIAWSLQQNGATVTGTASVTLQGTTLLSGTLSGTFANGNLAYIVSVPAGGASIAPECAGEIEGFATLSATALDGSAAIRTSSCAVGRPDVNFRLTKQ